MKYINDDISLGIEYDWKLIKKEYDKLKVPKEFYQIPWNAIINNNKYIIPLSERSTGKTTEWLLIGLCMNKLYGTVIQYIRATEDELKPSHAENLVRVIKEYANAKYIIQLTDGEYNDIYYHWKKFYYCYRDEESGIITKKSEMEIIQCLSVDNNMDYKSSYNAPKGDIIIFDEFIRKFYRPNECIDFMDLTKTIIRSRLSPIIIMLANTINLNSQYFEELEISRQVKKLQKGQAESIQTDYGTKIYVELIELGLTQQQSKEKTKHNTLFYGFKNPKLASITGGELWAFDSVQHIPTRDSQTNRIILYKNLYLILGIELLQLEIVSTTELGTHLEVHRASKYYDDSIILTLKELESKRHFYGLGEGKLEKILKRLVNDRRVYYSSNEVGSIFKAYIKQYQLSKNNY